MKARVIFFALLVMLTFGEVCPATDEYSEMTGRGCGNCHRDESGGGPLTPLGESYALGGYEWPIPEEAKKVSLSSGLKVVRFLLGFSHILAAIVWFGTIFYVHIVLKPSYAKGGLPKNEMRIAWVSIFVLAASGVPLTKLRFHNPSALLTTHSGNLLLIKLGLFAVLIFSAAYVTLLLSPKLKKLRSNWQDNNGREGRPAWVKVGDLLYDVTDSTKWIEGNHFGRHQAGEDLGEALKGAPHGIERLADFKSFSLAGEGLKKESAEIRLLFIMAYVNLFVAFGIVLILSLWRWG